MFRFFLLLVLIVFSTTMWAQKYEISGFVLDTEDLKPIVDVNITVVGESSGGVSDQKGFFQLRVNSLPALLYFSHLNYAVGNVTITKRNRNKVEILLNREITEINEVVVSGEKIQQVRFGVTLNVIDYCFVRSNRMVFVATPFRDQLDRHIYLTDLKGKSIDNFRIKGLGKEIKVPEHMTPETIHLFKDYLQCIQLLTKKDVKQIETAGDSLSISYSTNYPTFLKYVFPIKAIMGESLFFQQSSEIINKTLRTGPDAYRPQEVKTVRDPIGMPSEILPSRYIKPPLAPKNVHKYVSAPVVVHQKNLLIFDFFDNHIEFFDSLGNAVRKIPIDFHLIERKLAIFFTVHELNQECFNQEIYQDEVSGKLYAIFHRVGQRAIVKEIDPETGMVVSETEIPDLPNIHKIRIHNNTIYFLYQVKAYPYHTNLYRMKI